MMQTCSSDLSRIAAAEGTSTDGFVVRSLREENRINGTNGINQEDFKMKNYTITVNGNVYDVTVEEKGAGTAPVAPQHQAAPKAAPAAAPKAVAPAEQEVSR